MFSQNDTQNIEMEHVSYKEALDAVCVVFPFLIGKLWYSQTMKKECINCKKLFKSCKL